MTAPALVKRYGKGPDSDATDCLIAATLKGQRGKGGGGIGPEEQLIADTLTSGSHPGSNMPGRRREDDTNITVVNALKRTAGRQNGDPSGDYARAVLDRQGVRRLTPTECERLQGFPDDWTALGPDSRRCAALGDAVTVNVAHWIGRRLAENVANRRGITFTRAGYE